MDMQNIEYSQGRSYRIVVSALLINISYFFYYLLFIINADKAFVRFRGVYPLRALMRTNCQLISFGVGAGNIPLKPVFLK